MRKPTFPLEALALLSIAGLLVAIGASAPPGFGWHSRLAMTED
jgi:hypothetical protein